MKKINKALENNFKGNVVDKMKEKIIDEYLLVNNAFQSELLKMSDAEYSRYHQQNAEWYRILGDRFNQILGFTGKTQEDFINFMSSIQLTPEQKRALVVLRREPMFKKLMGETALQQKTELENILGSKITSEGMTFADENGARVAVKTEQQLDQELNSYSDKLSELLTSGSITEKQYDHYSKNMDYIYDYYMSCSRGDQVPYRKMTDAQYEQVEQKAMDNEIDFNEQLLQETIALKDEHEDIQELQNQGMKR